MKKRAQVVQRSHPALIYIPSLRQTNSDLESTCGQLRSDAEALRRSLDSALQRGRAAEGDRESMETQLAAKDAELEKFKLAMSSTVSCCCVKCVEACAPEKLLMCVHQCCSCRWWYNTRCLAKHLKPDPNLLHPSVRQSVPPSYWLFAFFLLAVYLKIWS